jgi:uncharacterized membrane protein YccC
MSKGKVWVNMFEGLQWVVITLHYASGYYLHTISRKRTTKIFYLVILFFSLSLQRVEGLHMGMSFGIVTWGSKKKRNTFSLYLQTSINKR